MKLTKSNITRVLKRAEHTQAKWNRSGMVRGWGSWSAGFHVTGEFPVYVEYRTDVRLGPEERTRKVRRYTEALAPYWAVAVDEESGRLVVSEKESAGG